MELPDRAHRSEDTFVQELSDRDDLDVIIQAIEAAIAERRPQLAARLVGLLDGRVEFDAESDLARAQNAARLLLCGEPPQPQWFDDLEEAWSRARHRRMKRIMRRMRATGSGSGARVGRLGNRRRS